MRSTRGGGANGRSGPTAGRARRLRCGDDRAERATTSAEQRRVALIELIAHLPAAPSASPPGRLSIDVRLVGTNQRPAAAFTSATVTLSSSSRIVLIRFGSSSNKREGRQQVGAAEPRHEPAFHVLEERGAQRGLRLRELRLA